SPSPVQGYLFFLNNGRLAFQMADGTFQNYLSSSPDLRDGRWHFIAVTVARCGANGNAGTFYLDGAFVSSFLDPRTGTLNNIAPLQIGRASPGFSGSFYSGCMDELEFFKRALTIQELQSIYNARSAGKCKVPCEAPSTVLCPSDKTVPCNVPWGFDPPTLFSGCCSNLTVTLLSSNLTSDIPCRNAFTGVWQAVDCSSNIVTCTQTVTVV